MHHLQADVPGQGTTARMKNEQDERERLLEKWKSRWIEVAVRKDERERRLWKWKSHQLTLQLVRDLQGPLSLFPPELV
jgi:hypothetical protein